MKEDKNFDEELNSIHCDIDAIFKFFVEKSPKFRIKTPSFLDVIIKVLSYLVWDIGAFILILWKVFLEYEK